MGRVAIESQLGNPHEMKWNMREHRIFKDELNASVESCSLAASATGKVRDSLVRQWRHPQLMKHCRKRNNDLMRLKYRI